VSNAFIFRGGVSNTRDSEALGSSMLDCRVYTKNRIRGDRFIGGTSGTIESLLAEGASGC